MPRRHPRTAGPLGAALLVMVLVGCSSQAYRVPDPPPEPAPSVTGPTAQLTEMLSEIATAFGTQEPHGNDLIDPGSTVQVAVADLRSQLQLSDQVAAVAAAWAQDWAEREPVASVELEVTDVEVIASWHGDPLARATIDVAVTQDPGPTTQEQYEYVLSWADGTLQYLAPLVKADSAVVIDSGVGLGSTTGAVRRFLDLVRQSQWSALARFSDGQNTDRTELEVFRSVIEALDLTLVEVPWPADDGTRTVYAITAINQVVAQFSVDTTERVVVFQGTG